MSWISPTFGDEPVRPPAKRSKPAKVQEPEDILLVHPKSSSCNWHHQFKPSTIEDLAVHVKKLKELQSWLENSTKANSRNKFLLLTGPSGCGKTTALQVVSKTLGVKVMEWITPLDKPDDNFEFKSRQEFSVSGAKSFEEYLLRSSRYSSCLIANPTKKLVLVKDFPNIFLHNPSTFHDILENVATKCLNPVVFVCSDDLQRKLFSVSMKSNLDLYTISFSPIPNQRMFKVLKSLLIQETKVNKSIKMLNDGVIQDICSSSQGDLRSAISKLKFSSVESNFEKTQTKLQGTFKKTKAINSEHSLEKDKKLDFFHGVGRVLYPKKNESSKVLKFVHSTESIVDTFLSEPNNFISQIHENYPTKLGNVYDLSDAAEKLSKSDLLMTRWQDKDIFHTYALSVTVQGLMVCNRNPQKAKFEAFRKSQTSRLDLDTKAIELEGKAMFSDLCILDYQSLLDVLPFSNSLLPNMNAGQFEFVRKTCSFKLQ